MSTRKPRVLISGASVAGPALAYWLVRHGFAPTVVERAPGVRKGGHNVDVRGVAIEVADRMGVLPQVRAAQTGMRGIAFRAATRRPIDIPVEALAEGEGDYNVEIARDDLCAILHEATRDDVEYVFGDSVTGLHQDSGQVRVTFEQRAPENFDLVVGADGLHSLTRRLAFPDTQRPYHHLGAYMSILDIPSELGRKDWTLFHNVPGRGVGLYSTPGGAKAFFAFRSPRPVEFDHRDEDQQKRIVAERFGDLGWKVPKLLAHMWSAPNFYFDMVAQVRMDRWSTGRVALVGDAGYGPSPLSGQGSSLALVGAYVLAGELGRAGGDHRAAFAGYENRMRDFVRRNQRIATSGRSLLLPATRAGLWLRDHVTLRVAPLLSRIGPRVDTIGRAATAIDLPDYRGLPTTTGDR